jgi:integrase
MRAFETKASNYRGQARAIVERRVGKRSPAELLFNGTGDPRKTLRQIIDASGVTFSAHDCRRTFATVAAARVPGYVLKALLNHSASNDVTSGYVHPDEDMLREAWQTVADLIVPAVRPVQNEAPKADVVPLREAA